MCGRYMFAATPQQLTERFALNLVPPELRACYNVAPQMHMPVIVATSPNRLDLMR